MSAETASTMGGRSRSRRSHTVSRQRRALAIRLIGPLTILAGIVWAVVQPYRIALIHPHGKTFYYFLIEPPLLVVLMGVVFMVCIAPGLLADLERS